MKEKKRRIYRTIVSDLERKRRKFSVLLSSPSFRYEAAKETLIRRAEKINLLTIHHCFVVDQVVLLRIINVRMYFDTV